MKKRIVSVCLCAVMAVTLMAGCGAPAAETGGNEEGGSSAAVSEGIPKDEIKVGFVHISDPSDMGYTYNHDLGTQEMQETLGLSDDQIINKYNVAEDASCDTALRSWLTRDAILFLPPASDLKIMWWKWRESTRRCSSVMLRVIRQKTQGLTISTIILLLSMRGVILPELRQG